MSMDFKSPKLCHRYEWKKAKRMVRKRFVSIPKINSNNYGGKWIAAGITIGVVLPALVWFVFHLFLWWLCIIGGIILAAFLVLFIIEMHQDFGKTPYYERHLKETIPFDRENQRAVIHASICTGETVAGFKNVHDGHFTEVMVIKTPEDLERFKRIYGIKEVKKEY